MLVAASPQCLDVKLKNIDNFQFINGLRQWPIEEFILQWAIDRNALDVVQAAMTHSPQSFDAKCCKSKVTKKSETPLHYVCYDKPGVPLQMMQLLAKSNALNTKDSKGKLPLRILYEEGRKKELICCLKVAMGPTAFDEMFGDVADSSQVVIK